MINLKKLLLALLLVDIVFTILGAYSKMTHKSWADITIEIALIALLCFMVLCLFSIIKSKSLSKSEKLLYLFAVILLPLFGGILFLLNNKDNI